MTHSRVIYVAVGGFLVGVLVCAVSFVFFADGRSTLQRPLRQSDVNPNAQYTLIDPLLALRSVDETPSPDYIPLEDALKKYVEEAKQKGIVQAASIRVRDINLSTGFTINPAITYTPASLFKVPILMAYLKLAESDESIFKEKIQYNTDDANFWQDIKPSVVLTKGKSYEVIDLLERLILYSDNNAAHLLEAYLHTRNTTVYTDLTKDLGIDEVQDKEDQITIQAYTLVFRVLYNSTYLSREMSEKALKLLSQAEFAQGIRQGVPASIEIAHKFGEFAVKEKDTNRVQRQELHDCGIVYYPKHPYILCVMTKGDDMKELQSFIGEVSSRVYGHVDMLYR